MMSGTVLAREPSPGRFRRGELALIQAATVLWVYAIYDRLRSRVAGSMTVAQRHAVQLIHLERTAGLNIEATVQHAAVQVPWLVAACNVGYSTTHLLAPPIVLVLLYRRVPERYHHWRNVFLSMLAVAILCFWLYPVMPPRLMPDSNHLPDTSTRFFNVNNAPIAKFFSSNTGSASPTWTGSTNSVAAMPSLHVGWAVWAAAALWPLLRRRWAKALVAGYAAAMMLAVVVTANHWLLDVVGGVLVVAVCHLAVSALERPVVPIRDPVIIT